MLLCVWRLVPGRGVDWGIEAVVRECGEPIGVIERVAAGGLSVIRGCCFGSLPFSFSQLCFETLARHALLLLFSECCMRTRHSGLPVGRPGWRGEVASLLIMPGWRASAVAAVTAISLVAPVSACCIQYCGHGGMVEVLIAELRAWGACRQGVGTQGVVKGRTREPREVRQRILRRRRCTSNSFRLWVVLLVALHCVVTRLGLHMAPVSAMGSAVHNE